MNIDFGKKGKGGKQAKVVFLADESSKSAPQSRSTTSTHLSYLAGLISKWERKSCFCFR